MWSLRGTLASNTVTACMQLRAGCLTTLSLKWRRIETGTSAHAIMCTACSPIVFCMKGKPVFQKNPEVQLLKWQQIGILL
jgi:hypothetical protein